MQPTWAIKQPPFCGSICNFCYINDLWTTTTCKQRPLFLGPKGGRCTQAWLQKSLFLIVCVIMSLCDIDSRHLCFFRFTVSIARTGEHPSSTGYPIPKTKIGQRKRQAKFPMSLRLRWTHSQRIVMNRKPKVSNEFSLKLIRMKAAQQYH